jgi:hypothetical protein
MSGPLQDIDRGAFRCACRRGSVIARAALSLLVTWSILVLASASPAGPFVHASVGVLPVEPSTILLLGAGLVELALAGSVRAARLLA